VISARHLLKREVGKAIDSARAYVKGESQTGQFTAVGPDAYTLVRAELAAVNASAAKRLIANRRKGGTVHYLDDLFLARAALGLGNEAEAAVHFAALCHSVEKYQAQGRLDFEILLACELQPLALLKLDRQAAALREQHFERTRAGNTDLAPATTDKGLNGIISSSARMAELKKTISTYALSDLPVLIVGETGTGKDLIARALHESGPRRGKPYVTVNCGAISESLIESELFGYASGAFTGASTSHSGLFEEAGEGTIFLDEIGDISPRLQIALLRVLETGEVRAVGSTKMRYTKCRVITATNTDLVRAAEQGRFRQDLLFRLQRLEIRTPPLRERSKDIITLADYFLNLDRAQGVKATLSLELQTELCRRQWPGNVRELRNAIERMRILNSDKLHYRIEDFINIESPSATRADDTQNTSSIVGGFQSDQPADLSSKTPWGQKPAAAPQALDQASAYRSARRRREYLALLFEQHKSLHLYEVREMLGVSTATASRDLKSLVDDGIIERCAPTNSPRTFYYKFFK
jgi:transcriptional regulator with GAF, ATPase, and Fis domain